MAKSNSKHLLTTVAVAAVTVLVLTRSGALQHLTGK